MSYNYWADSMSELQRQHFDYLWREQLITIHPFDKMTRDQCEELKQWAFNLYKRINEG